MTKIDAANGRGRHNNSRREHEADVLLQASMLLVQSLLELKKADDVANQLDKPEHAIPNISHFQSKQINENYPHF